MALTKTSSLNSQERWWRSIICKEKSEFNGDRKEMWTILNQEKFGCKKSKNNSLQNFRSIIAKKNKRKKIQKEMDKKVGTVKRKKAQQEIGLLQISQNLRTIMKFTSKE